VVQLVKTKKPKILFWQTSRTVLKLLPVLSAAEQVIAGIQAGVFYPNPT